MNTKNVLIGLGVVVLLVLGVTFPRGNSVVQQIVGASAGPDHYGIEQFLGGFLRGNYNATTTGATVTLKQSDLVGFDVIRVTPIVGATTLTFPASSTLTNLVPKTGNMQETCFINGTSTASMTLTFAASTGVDWETAVASSTGLQQNPVTVNPGGTACFKFIRGIDVDSPYDIKALYVQYVNAD